MEKGVTIFELWHPFCLKLVIFQKKTAEIPISTCNLTDGDCIMMLVYNRKNTEFYKPISQEESQP